MSLKKIILTPYFGAFPEWMDKFEPPAGYDWLLDTDIEKFRQRVRDKLGIEFPGVYGSPKVWDYRCALGLLYEEEIKSYDYWGTCDFDVVFGDVNKFFPDEELIKWDIWSNHDSYVCGFWSLYKNCKEVNELFLKYSEWKYVLENQIVFGWVETAYSRLLEQSELRYKYSGDLQGNPYNPPFNLIKEDGRLAQFHHLDLQGTHLDDVSLHWPLSEYILHYGDSDRTPYDRRYVTVYKEIPMLHFRRLKEYPI